MRRYMRKRLDVRPAVVIRNSIRLPPTVPSRWVPQYAFQALCEALRRQSPTYPREDAIRHATRAIALMYFPDGTTWVKYGSNPQLCVPCPACGSLARALTAGPRGWQCRGCRHKRMESWLARHLANFACAARMGLGGVTLRRLHQEAVLALCRYPYDTMMLVGGRTVLLLHRPQDLRRLVHSCKHSQRGIGKLSPPWGPIHQMLAPLYVDALWDQLLSPDAYYQRFAFR
jgi:hypothetical protein